VTDPKEVSSAFNDYSNIAENILKERKYSGDGNFIKFMPAPHEKSFFLSETDPVEVKNRTSKNSNC
jgi:hypothetical protein